MVGADDAAVNHPLQRRAGGPCPAERTATVDTSVAQYPGFTLGITKHNKIDAHDIDFLRRVMRQIFTTNNRIPEVDIHLFCLQALG